MAKGANIAEFDMKDKPDLALLSAHMLGPTGNLRAPTIRVGKTIVVGFNESVYSEVLGKQ